MKTSVLFGVLIGFLGFPGCSSAPHTEGEADEVAALAAPGESLAGSCLQPGQLASSPSRSMASVTPIEARSFSMTLLKPPLTGKKVHTFSYSDSSAPQERRIILIRDQNEPVAAIRVLRSVSSQKKFYGVVVCQYEKAGGLKPDKSYTGLEKLRDL